MRFSLGLLLFACSSIRCLAVSDMLRTDECKQLLKMGNEAYNEDRFDAALDLYTKSLELADQQGDITTYTSALGSIGNLYGLFKDYERAGYYFEKGYKATLQQDEKLQSIFLTNLIMCYSYFGDAKSTHTYYDKLKPLPEWDPVLAPYYEDVCRSAVAIVDEDYETARFYTYNGLEKAQKQQLGIQYELSQHETLGIIYERIGQMDSALVHFSTIVELGWPKGCVELRQGAYQHLSDIYAQLGDSANSRDFAIRNVMLRDTLQHGEKMHMALNRLFAYEKRANDKQVMSLHKTIDRQWYFIGIFVLIVLALVTLSLIALSKNKKLNIAYRLLVEKNQEQIRAMERERELLEQKEQISQEVPMNTVHESFDDKNRTISEGENEEPLENLMLSQQQVRQLRESIDSVMSDMHTISNPDFNLTLLAKLVESNTKYVSYVINKTYQKNFKTYLNEFRVREASRKLSDPQYAHLTIQAVAEMVGFNSPNTFITAFKKIIGMTPSVYQKLAKEKE